MGRRSPENAYPEGTEYRDEGCGLHPSCLACPRERCVEDEPQPMRTRKEVLVLAPRMRELADQGRSYSAIARELHVSTSSIHRLLGPRKSPK